MDDMILLILTILRVVVKMQMRMLLRSGMYGEYDSMKPIYEQLGRTIDGAE